MNILVLTLNKRSMVQEIFSDLEGLDNAVVIEESFIKPKNKLLRLLHRIHYSPRINRLFNLPFKNIWKSRYPP